MIIAATGQKGGSGKTTIALALAFEWLRLGLRVLLVDADPQGSARTWGQPGFVPAGQDRALEVLALPGQVLPEKLQEVARGYDRVVVDCPPRHGELVRAILMAVDLALVPCGPSALDIFALAESAELIAAARRVRPRLLAYVVLTKRQRRTALGAGARRSLAQAGLPLLDTELGYRVAYQEAPAAGVGITTYEPSGPAAREVRALARELERKGNVHGKVEARRQSA